MGQRTTTSAQATTAAPSSAPTKINIQQVETDYLNTIKTLAQGNQALEAFMLRIALVESNLGKTPGTFTKSNTRGVTQVERVLFNNLQRHHTAQVTLQKAGIDDFDDLKSNGANMAIVTRAALRTNPLFIPGDLAAQAAYWKVYWNTNAPNAKGTTERFLRDAGKLQGKALQQAEARAQQLVQVYQRAKDDGLLNGDAKALATALETLDKQFGLRP